MPYPEGWEQEVLFGLGYPGSDGVISSAAAEQLRTEQIARVLAAVAGALGVGIYDGGDATVGATGVDVTAAVAIVQDELGWLPIQHAAATVLATEFATGTSYLHLQAGETAREDGGCGYYVSTSATPAAGAVLICSVTASGGAVTAVDNSVRTSPAITPRLPWAELAQQYADDETLLDWLTERLGADYAAATPPSTVDARLHLLEAAAFGETELPDIPTEAEIEEIAEAAATAAITEHVEEYHGSTGGTGGTTAAEQWDCSAVNGLRLALQAAHWLPNVTDTMVDAVLVVDGHCGSQYVDTENSTF